ncbi:porin [uncultured Algibacter sp.]|uniref:porin n=1 Tax=uncultured Algibacter sp. TaxID=298659 RepID=UPI0026346A15|nr:porin [uncultured Algibacter sp.]
MNTKTALLGMFLLAMITTQGQEIKSGKFGKGLLNIKGKDSSFTMKVGFRFQLLGVANFNESGETNTNFLVRRSRLKFDGFVLNPKLRYKFELGLSNRDISGLSVYNRNTPRYIMDAQIKWNFYRNFELWVGQGKLPGNRERVVSSGDLQLVNRSLLNANFNIDRDIGFQLRHHFNLTDSFIVREIFSLSQGEGRNQTVGNLGGLQYTGRLELLPFGNFASKGDYKGSDLKREQKPKLSIGATYDHNNNAVRARSNLGAYMLIDDEQGLYQTDINTVFVDGMLKYKGNSFMFEYANRTADDPIVKNSDGTETGQYVRIGHSINLQAGHLFPSNWEIAGRYTNTYMEFPILANAHNTTDMYTLGVSRFIVGHKLKIQSDVSYLDISPNSDNIMVRLQMDIHF